jgi:hypothetical protein
LISSSSSGLDLLKLERGGDRQDFRQQRPERTRSENGGRSRDGFDDALDAVDRDPERVDRQQMRQAAGHDEDRECPVDPPKLEVAPLGDQNGQGDRNREIGGGDDGVGGDVEPDQLGLPQQADAVR